MIWTKDICNPKQQNNFAPLIEIQTTNVRIFTFIGLLVEDDS
jgi:hypothetical protein